MRMDTAVFPDLESVLAQLDALTSDITVEAVLVQDKLPELRRQAMALTKRRGGPGSRDAGKYALGSVFVMVGAEDVGDTALLGLLAHPDRMVRWAIEARLAGAPAQFGKLVEMIFEAPRRRDWCERWGRILQWRYRAPMYEASVRSFLDSGQAGPKERWRTKDITDDQISLVMILVGLLAEPTPELRTRGEAFDWIYARGGNPTYWKEPAPPEEWEELDG